MALRVLNGERPQDIPIEKTANVYMFDWRALRRWGLKETDLPPDSVLLHKAAQASGTCISGTSLAAFLWWWSRRY